MESPEIETSGYELVQAPVTTTGTDWLIGISVFLVLVFLGLALGFLFRKTGCKTPDDCKYESDEKKACDPETKTCVQCVNVQDCNNRANSCVNNVCKCGTNAACNFEKPICTEIDGKPTCVECTQDNECPVSEPNCDTTTHTCFGCNSDTITKDPYQCAPGYQCREDSCFPQTCSNISDCAYGQSCNDDNVCSGMSTFYFQRNVNLPNVPKTLLLSETNNTGAASNPTLCSNECGANDACAIFDWKMTNDGNKTCRHYTSKTNESQTWKEYEEPFAEGTAWAGGRKDFQNVGTCNGIPCVVNSEGYFIIPDSTINLTEPYDAFENVTNMDACISSCAGGRTGCQDNLAYGAVWNTTANTCKCFNFDKTDMASNLVTADNQSTAVACVNRAEMPT
jgi:hypothetical protein